jgi:hypothetical protein
LSLYRTPDSVRTLACGRGPWQEPTRARSAAGGQTDVGPLRVCHGSVPELSHLLIRHGHAIICDAMCNGHNSSGGANQRPDAQPLSSPAQPKACECPLRLAGQRKAPAQRGGVEST